MLNVDQLTSIYLNLDSDKFAEAVAGDERSYKKELFDKKCSIDRVSVQSLLFVCFITNFFGH